jgi:hypothetical protein
LYHSSSSEESNKHHDQVEPSSSPDVFAATTDYHTLTTTLLRDLSSHHDTVNQTLANCTTNVSNVNQLGSEPSSVFFGIFLVSLLACFLWLCWLLGREHSHQRRDAKKKRQRRLETIKTLMHTRVWCREDEERHIQKETNAHHHVGSLGHVNEVGNGTGSAELTEPSSSASIEEDEVDVHVNDLYCQACNVDSAVEHRTVPDLEQGSSVVSVNNAKDRRSNDDDGNETASSSSSTNHHDELHATCPICLCDFELGDKVCHSNHPESCAHEFHSDCIKAWLIEHGDCPMCREPFL